MAVRHAIVLLLVAGCASAPRPQPAHGGLRVAIDDLPVGSKVAVAGSFNGWDPHATPLRESSPGSYEGLVQLKPGVYRLQLVVLLPDGTERWIAPPGLGRSEPDGFGGSNAVVEVEP